MISQSLQRRITDWTAGVQFPAKARHFCVLNSVHTISGVVSQSAIKWVNIYWGAPSSGIRWSGLKLTPTFL
jgi:hypothetical protein